MEIFQSGLSAAATIPAVQRVVSLQKNELRIGSKTYNLKNYQNLYVIGVGKAALDAATALEEILDGNITAGVVLDIRAGKLKHIKIWPAKPATSAAFSPASRNPDRRSSPPARSPTPKRSAKRKKRILSRQLT